MKNEEGNKLERLQKQLDARDYIEQGPLQERSRFEASLLEVEKGWKHEQLPERHRTPSIIGPFFKKVFIGSVIFFFIALGVAAYLYLTGFSFITTDKIDIAFLGPVSVAAGEELAFDVVVTNGNNTQLINPVVYIDYPEGTKEVGDLTKDLTHEKYDLGTIVEHGNARRTIRSVLFGEQHARREIKVTLEYGVRNSNATFRKEKVYEVAISSAPLVMTVTGPAEASSGDIVEFNVAVTSNSSVPLLNLLLKAEYPFGFEATESEPQASFDNSIWEIPSLKPGERKTFAVRGRLEGEENDERAFRFAVGMQSTRNEKEIATVYLKDLDTITLHKPAIGVTVQLNGSESKEIALDRSGAIVGTVEVVNNLPVQLVNGQVRVVFKGSIFDSTTPRTEGGIYRIADKTMTWDRASVPALAALDPGARIVLGFGFNTLPQAALDAIKNGSMTVEVFVAGYKITDLPAGSQSVPVSSYAARLIKIRSTASLLARTLFVSGPFKNTGPLPPRVDQKTTYTIAWTLANSSNLVSGAEVKTTLPYYVKWLGVVSPQGERVTWNPNENTVVWRVGDIPPGGRAVKEVFFQIELQPTNSQFKTEPLLTGDQVLTGIDSFTSQPIEVNVRPVSADLGADARAAVKDGTVSK